MAGKLNRRQLYPDYCGSRGPFIKKMKTSCEFRDRLHDVQLSWYCIYHSGVRRNYDCDSIAMEIKTKNVAV